jgi:hypothetical protein
MKVLTTLTITTITILLISMIFCYAEDRYEAGEESQYITTADLNNDGYIDFCVNNYKGNSIFVYLNKRDGKYASPVIYTTEDYPNKVVFADINNDDFLDVLLTFNGPHEVDIFFNKRDGSFGEPTKYYPENYSFINRPPTVADINNDGWLDILLVGQANYILMVMMNNGDGTYAEANMIGSSAGSTNDSPQIADVDNNGFMDVFVTSIDYGKTTSSIIFLKNKGDGTFYEPVFYETLSHFSQVTFVDVDNDGFIDLLCDNPNSNNISIFYNNHDATFKEPINYDTGTYPLKITPADINKDGCIDLLVSNLNSQNLSIFQNNSNGTFKNPITYITGERPRPIVASDLNNDSWIDIIVSCNPLKVSNDIRIYLNKGDGTFTESENYGRGYRFMAEPVIVDINNDGLLDIIQSDKGGGTNNVNGSVSVFRNVGNGKLDNSGIDLRSDPNKKASLGNNVKIIVDFRTFPKSVNVDLYFVMINPQVTIYSGLAWNEGIFPALRNLSLPANTNLFDLTLCEFTIPSQAPPVSTLGTYTFVMAMFKPGTAEMLSFMAKTTFEVVQ